MEGRTLLLSTDIAVQFNVHYTTQILDARAGRYSIAQQYSTVGDPWHNSGGFSGVVRVCCVVTPPLFARAHALARSTAARTPVPPVVGILHGNLHQAPPRRSLFLLPTDEDQGVVKYK